MKFINIIYMHLILKHLHKYPKALEAGEKVITDLSKTPKYSLSTKRFLISLGLSISNTLPTTIPLTEPLLLKTLGFMLTTTHLDHGECVSA